MKFVRNNNKFLKALSLLVLSLLFLIAVTFVDTKLVLADFNLLRANLVKALEDKNVLEKSTATFSLQDNNLKVRFQIAKKDQLKVQTLSKNLSLGDNWRNGLTLGLNEETSSKLENILPLTLNLRFEDQKISFESSDKGSLISSAKKEEYSFATSSASLKLITAGEGNFKLELKDPDILVNYATATGVLRLSPELTLLYPLSQKVATINLEVLGKAVKGEIWIQDKDN